MKVMDVIAHGLLAEGVSFITGFPHNQIIDACSNLGIRPLMARTERVAINIADGYSRMSAGRSVGVVAVQFGPGIENGSGAVAQAFADGSGILVLPGGYETREAGVTPNFRAEDNMRQVTKAVMSVNHPDSAALFLIRSFGLLRTGKPGPVVVEIPDDLMTAETSDRAAKYEPVAAGLTLANPNEIEAVIKAVSEAKHPVFVAGRGVLHSGAWVELRELAELLHVPVLSTLAGKSAFPEDHPLALGTGGLSRPAPVDQFLAEADLVVGFGTSFTRSHYTVRMPDGVRIIQVTNDPQDVAKSYRTERLVLGDLQLVLPQLKAVAAESKPRSDYRDSPAAQLVRERKRRFLDAWSPRLECDAEPISPYRVVFELMRAVDKTRTVVTHDSGNPRDQIVPFYEAIVPCGYIGWGKSTQLGSGLGLIMGAKLAKPDWLAVNLMGDASFGMVGLDIETAVRCQIPILTIVLNNGLMGGYEEHLPIATRKHNVHLQGGNYRDVALALGARAERVEKVAELAPALANAIRATKEGFPAVVEVLTRPEPVFPIGPVGH
jgi:acetolactate synthase-1/2/3 large subunit